MYRLKRRHGQILLINLLAAGLLAVVFLHPNSGSIHPKHSSADTAPIASDCSSDVTGAINSYIAAQPDGSTVTFKANACYRVEGMILVQDRRNLTINGNNATFKSTTIPISKHAVPMWRITGGANITLTNITAQGINPSGSYNSEYEFSHNFQILGTQGVVMNGLHGRNAYGDFVYIGPDARNKTSVMARYIKLTNSDSNITGRNGLSCTGCEDVTVSHNSFANNGYVGFDLETEGTTWYGRNIEISDNKFGVTHLGTFNITSNAGGVNTVKFSGNTITDYGQSCIAAVNIHGDAPIQNITVSNNVLLARKTGVSAIGVSGLTLTGNQIKVSGAGCQSPAGFNLTNITNGTVSQNDIKGSVSSTALTVLTQPTTGLTICNNRSTVDSAFNKPVVCAVANSIPTSQATPTAPSTAGGGGTKTTAGSTSTQNKSASSGTSQGSSNGSIIPTDTPSTSDTTESAPDNLLSATTHPRQTADIMLHQPLKHIALIGQLFAVILVVVVLIVVVIQRRAFSMVALRWHYRHPVGSAGSSVVIAPPVNLSAPLPVQPGTVISPTRNGSADLSVQLASNNPLAATTDTSRTQQIV